MTYLAQVRLDRIRARWRARWIERLGALRAGPARRQVQTAPAALLAAPSPIGLAEAIALAAGGKARLEVSTVGVSLPRAPARQRWVALERSPSEPVPTVAVIVQGERFDALGSRDGGTPRADATRVP